MNMSLEEASSSCAVNNVYNLEMILDLNSSSNAINYDTFVNYTGNNENGMPVSNTPSEAYDRDSYSNKENLSPVDIFKCFSNKNNYLNKVNIKILQKGIVLDSKIMSLVFIYFKKPKK